MAQKSFVEGDVFRKICTNFRINLCVNLLCLEAASINGRILIKPSQCIIIYTAEKQGVYYGEVIVVSWFRASGNFGLILNC